MELRPGARRSSRGEVHGDDGFALTLSRASAATPPARTAPGPDAAAAPAGPLDREGRGVPRQLGRAARPDDPDGYFVETFTTEVKARGAGVYEATQKIVIRLTVNGRTDRLTVTGRSAGTRGARASSRVHVAAADAGVHGTTEEIGAGTLEVHVEDGKLTGRVGNATDGYTPFSLIRAR